MNLRMNPFKNTSKFEDYMVLGIGFAILVLIIVAASIWLTQWAWHNFMGSVFGMRDLTNWEAFAFGLLSSSFRSIKIGGRKS